MSKSNIFRGAMTLLIALGILIPQGVAFASSPSTPVTVELSVSPSGGKGGMAVATCKVSSTVEIQNLKVSITATNRVSYLSTNKWTTTIAEGGASEYSTTMLFSSEGNMSVTCTALGPNQNGTRWGDAQTLYYNVSASAVTEGWIMPKNFQRNAAKLLDENAPELAAATSEFSGSVPGPESVSPDGSQPSEPSGPIAQATTCYRGRWYFYDRGTYAPPAAHATAASRALMALRPLTWASVWLWDDDGAAGDDYLGAALTDENGYWSLCVTNPQADGDAIDLYVEAAMANTWYDVSPTAAYNPYYWYTSNKVATWANTAGATFNTGAWYIPNTSANLLAAWTFNDLTRANWYFRDPHRVNSDPSAPTTMEYTVALAMVSRTKWDPASVDGTYYSFGDDTIHLQGNDPRTYSALTHEWGHFVMNRLYGADAEWPTGFGDCPSPHFYNGVSGGSCAWSEGFADAVALLVPNDPLYRWASGATANNETRAGFAAGDAVEGNVAATFWDWMDKTNDGVAPNRDYVQLSFDSFLKAFNVQNDDRFLDYWNYWKSLGEWCTPARAALKNNINTDGYNCP